MEEILKLSELKQTYSIPNAGVAEHRTGFHIFQRMKDKHQEHELDQQLAENKEQLDYPFRTTVLRSYIVAYSIMGLPRNWNWPSDDSVSKRYLQKRWVRCGDGFVETEEYEEEAKALKVPLLN